MAIDRANGHWRALGGWMTLAVFLSLPGYADAQPARGRADFEKVAPVPEPPGAAVSPVPQRPQPAQPRPPGAQPVTPARPVIIWDPAREAGQRTDGTGRPTAGHEARVAAETFYRTALQLRAMGVPNATQRSRLRPHLSPSLEAALAAAAQAEQTHRATGEPPLHEGDLFSALHEGPSLATVRGCEVSSDRAICTVQLSRAEGTGGERSEWQDTLTLVRTSMGWRLDDVTYGGRFAFGNLGTLRDLLTVLIRQTAPTTPPLGAPPPGSSTSRDVNPE